MNVFAAAARSLRAGRPLRDWLLALALGGMTAVAMTASAAPSGWWAVLSGGVAALSVWFARPYPRSAVVVLAVAALVSAPPPWDTPLTVLVALFSYLAGRRLSSERSVVPLFAVVAAVGAVVVLARHPELASWASLGLWWMAVLIMPWLLGRNHRHRRQLAEAGWERAHRLEQEQRVVAEQARLRERARIAGDMHDSLGHELSLLALRAAGMEVAPELSDEHRQAAAQIRTDAARAIQRLGTIVGVLHDDAEGPSSRPADETLQQLVERVAASGARVSLEVDTELPEPWAVTYRATHRVIQESLTNATKHAPGSDVRVRVGEEAGTVKVTVTNGPSTTTAQPVTKDGRGFGLIGLEERARLIGGRLTAGPTNDGGFEVSAHLPRTPPGRETPPASAPDATDGSLSGGSQTLLEREVAHGRARRSLGLAIAVPAAAIVAAAAGVTGFWTYETSTTVLDGRTFAGLEVGMPVAQVTPDLPPREVTWGHESPQPAIPDGAVCRYYRSGRHPFVAQPLHRLCFADGALAGKHVISAVEDASS